jgi:hypothetical protein
MWGNWNVQGWSGVYQVSWKSVNCFQIYYEYKESKLKKYIHYENRKVIRLNVSNEYSCAYLHIYNFSTEHELLSLTEVAIGKGKVVPVLH